MPAQKFNIEEIREKHGWRIPQMKKSVYDLAEWADEVSARLVREGKIKIVKGRIVKLDQGVGNV